MKKILSALLAALVVSSLHSAYADTATQEYNFEIARQPLEATLKEFSRQTGLNTGFLRKNREQRDIIVGPLKGRHTAAEAMSALLEETGLTFKQTNEFSISVLARDTVKSARDGGAPKTRAAKGPKFVHLAGSQFLDDIGDEAGAQRVAAVESSDEIQTAKELSESNLIDEVIVAGSHIRGVENMTVPIIVLSKEYIDSTGVSTVTRLVESLPQNFSLNNQSTVQTPGVARSTHQGSSMNLRGLGEGTTLILLNGRRMAPGNASTSVDISALPLSAVDRVEVMTDGASALYGSDAVGGVVNFVLKDDFEGVETRVRTGWGDAINEYRLSQAVGNAWDSGNALLSLEFYKRDLLSPKDRDFVPNAVLVGSLLPEDKNYSALLSGQQHVAEKLKVFADALFTQRDAFHRGGLVSTNDTNHIDNSQVVTNLGAEWDVGEDWQIEASGSHANNNMHLELTSNPSVEKILFEVGSAQLKADGSLANLPGGSVGMAVGVEWRTESFRNTSLFLSNARPGTLQPVRDLDQIIRSAFGEIYVPIVGPANATVAARRLELSLAGRYDDYSNVGSSFDPKVGLMWEPISGLRLRGSYGSSYKAPTLLQYSATGTVLLARYAPDPGLAGSPSFRLEAFGTDTAGLSPQKSESSSFGLEFTPESISGLRLAANYYRIKYKDRIASPGFDAGALLSDPVAYGRLITRNPTVQQVNDLLAIAGSAGLFIRNLPPNASTFSPELVNTIVDLRTRNVSVTDTSGLDVSIQYDFAIAEGNVHFGLDGTHIYELLQRITPTSTSVDRIDTIYNPADWRVRGSAAWQQAAWAANFFVNYVDSYIDNRTVTPVPISSYTTVDARLAYDFGSRAEGSVLSGTTVSINVQNLFDRDPPRTRLITPFDLSFDSTNASPLGRFIAIEVSKLW